jgi:glycerophosphoryl diester phosphodiesterase
MIQFTNIFRAVLGDFIRSLPQLIGYEVLFKILAVALLTPLSAFLLAALISSSGRVAVSNEEIVTFALSATGILTVIVMGTLTIAIIFAEQAGLLLIGASRLSERTLHTMPALLQTGRRAGFLARLALLQVVGYLLCLAPFLVVAAITYKVLLPRDINYYLAAKPPEFWLAVAIGGVCVVGMLLAVALLYVLWIFALPVGVLERKASAWASLRASHRMVRGSLLRTAGVLVTWALGVVVLGALFEVLLAAIQWGLLGVAGDSVPGLVASVALLMTLHVIVAAAVTFFAVAANCLLLLRLYQAALQRLDEPFPETHGHDTETDPHVPAWLSRKRVAYAAVLVLLVGTGIASVAVVENAGIDYGVEVTAHRGASLVAPENSISAIERAIEAGAQWAEIDVQETRDGTIVLLHDTDLMRVAAVDKNIWEVDYNEIKDLDAGSWFSEDYRGEKIPTLQQAIDVARGRIKLNIELKFNGQDKRLAERVAEIVSENEFEAQCAVTSLTYDGLLQAKESHGKLKVGFIVFRAVGDVAELPVDLLSINAGYITREMVERLHAAGKPVHVWTVNDREGMLDMIDLGVDNILTDDPALLVSVLEERRNLSNAEKILLQFHSWLGR